MITFDELKEKWNTMPVYGHGYLLVDDSHSVEINIGYEEISQKTLLVQSDYKIENIISSKSIKAKCEKVNEKQWGIFLQLVKIDNEEVFLRLCWDIIESSRNVKQNRIQFIYSRYLKWSRLLELQRKDTLSESRRKGLLGELLYLKEKIKTKDKEATLKAWSGPDGADQDFVFENGWAEIKTIGISIEMVSISSLEQLDVSQNGYLVIYRADRTTNDNEFGISLKSIVEELFLEFGESIEQKEWFKHKLFMYGYKDNDENNDLKYRVSGCEKFLVTETFPRLIKNNVPIQIGNAKYTIIISAINDYIC